MTANFQGILTSLRRCCYGSHRPHDRMWIRRKTTSTRNASATTTTRPPKTKKIAIAMSGGVDSSVAAYILQQHYQDVDIIGLHMSNWNPLDEDLDLRETKQKCHEQDLQDTQRVCDFLDIPFHPANFVAEYWTDVFEPFVEQISLNGQMPNPDVGCNSKIKFGKMKEYALQRLQVDAIATGHYARLWYTSPNIKQELPWIVQQPQLEDEMQQVMEESINDDDSNSSLEWLLSQQDTTTPLLVAGADVDKDQSYFLSGVQSHAFRNVIFPLGQFHKTTIPNNSSNNNTNSESDDTKSKLQTVRDIANEAKLPTATKKESMGICFVGKRNFGPFISQYLPSYEPSEDKSSSGNFVDIDTGCIVGQHDGLPYYTLTLGQGAKISGASQKWFVAGRRQRQLEEKSNSKDTTIFVCNHTHHPSLYADELYIENFNWILPNGLPPKPLLQHGHMRALCRTRHLQPLVPCEVILAQRDTWGGTSTTTVTLKFDRPLRAMTPGQMAVVYVGGKGVVCLGGGPISNHGPTYHEQHKDLPRDLHPSGQNDLSLEKRRQRLP